MTNQQSPQFSSQLEKFTQKMQLLQALGSAQSVLSWDRETHMPQGASADRGQVMSVLAGFSHQLFTDKDFVQVVNELQEHRDQLSPEERRCIILTKKGLDKSLKLSREFVEETNTITNAAHAAWLEAKQTNNFALFEPHLEAVIENRKQYAHFLAPDQDPYDVNLDDYEEGLTAAALVPLFDHLKKGLQEILPQVLKKQEQCENPLNNVYINPHHLENFITEMITKIGFDLKRGAMGKVEHPFEISISPNDIRLNTKYTTEEHSFTIMGMIHELGHGLYEQNVDPKYVKYFLDNGVSLGIHESQSRFLENIIGRSEEFWMYFLPQLKAECPELYRAELPELVKALNYVQPTFIRTEADEVTYNLHILVRFELENALLHNQLQVKDLPEAWSAKMKEVLGIEPATHRDGVLQDVHWSWGNFGYFPTYTLGNLNAAQMLLSFEKAHPKWRQEISEGNFTSYNSWFKDNVWQHGSFLTPDEVMLKATGEKTNAEYFLKYLKKKYLGEK